MGVVHRIAGLLPEREQERLRGLVLRDEGHGFDVFGANAAWISMGEVLASGLYEKWFRVDSHGSENIPPHGAAILAANHSGTLPYDGLMIWTDVLRRSEPPRIVRPVMDHFVPMLPFFGKLLTRIGAIGGSRGNAQAALAAGELLLIFPEGTTGIGKPFRERYRLQDWRVGHAELAIRWRVPVIPTAVVGAEEQMPQIARIEWGVKRLGAPYLPIAWPPLPLPVRYRIYYGDPIDFSSHWSPEEANHPATVERAAIIIRDRVQSLIDRGLAERKGLFS